MNDTACIEFLQWALPRLGLRWSGFRRVRRQVCRRIQRRTRALSLPDVAAYRDFLQANHHEWEILGHLCRVTVSRFFRDREVFRNLGQVALPFLSQQAVSRGDTALRIWSAGCASGEEPYSIALLWRYRLAQRFPTLELHVIATDIDAAVLQRAATGCYPSSSLREVPQPWREGSFRRADDHYQLIDPARHWVQFVCHNVRDVPPDGLFDLVFCRNLVFTYFDEPSQRDSLARLCAPLRSGGALVIGIHERLPACAGFSPWGGIRGVYHRAPRNHTTFGA